MSADNAWIMTRITEARSSHPSVTEVVSARMKELLSSHFASRQLSQLELANVAKALIADMVAAPPEPRAKS